MKVNLIYNKSCQGMDELPDECIDCTITSPPYWALRDYGVKGQLGLEPTFQLYLDHIVTVCAEVKRVLKGTGSFWLNMGDTYSATRWANTDTSTGPWKNKRILEANPVIERITGLPDKCLVGVPWRLALRLVDDQGWILRNAIIWHKPNPMPSSVKDRCGNNYEFLFHLVKQKKYYYDLDAIRERHKQSSVNRIQIGKEELRPQQSSEHIKGVGYKLGYKKLKLEPSGKNPGDVWTIPTQPRPEAHFATFPDKLCEKPIKATCPSEICKKCGKARVRIVKPTEEHAKRLGKSWHDHSRDMVVGAGQKKGTACTASYETIGWTDCGCNVGFEPGTVLDPFAGRGTALIMAKKLGRHYVGYELKKEYADMARRELENIDPLFAKLE